VCPVRFETTANALSHPRARERPDGSSGPLSALNAGAASAFRGPLLRLVRALVPHQGASPSVRALVPHQGASPSVRALVPHQGASEAGAAQAFNPAFAPCCPLLLCRPPPPAAWLPSPPFWTPSSSCCARCSARLAVAPSCPCPAALVQLCCPCPVAFFQLPLSSFHLPIALQLCKARARTSTVS
jgi:hypothetical protein